MCIFPLTSSLHPAVLIVWGTQHGTHSFFLRELSGDTVKTKYYAYLHVRQNITSNLGPSPFLGAPASFAGAPLIL